MPRGIRALTPRITTSSRLYGTAARAALAASRMLGLDQRRPLLPFPAEPELPAIDSPEVAATQPHAMVNDAGDVFYPDDIRDAYHFAEEWGARYLNGDPLPPLPAEPAATDEQITGRPGRPW